MPPPTIQQVRKEVARFMARYRVRRSRTIDFDRDSLIPEVDLEAIVDDVTISVVDGVLVVVGFGGGTGSDVVVDGGTFDNLGSNDDILVDGGTF
jgi:hypothetical protein